MRIGNVSLANHRVLRIDFSGSNVGCELTKQLLGISASA